MKFRRAASAALAAAMLTSSVCIVAEAADKTENKTEMEQELTYVKQRITIPEELTEFNHSTGTKYNSKRYYNFNWHDEEYKNNLDVSIIGKVITDYHYYDSSFYSSNKAGFAKLSNEELIKKAKAWVEKLNPTISKYIEVDESSLYVSLTNNYANISVSRVYNGIKVAGATGYMELDKNTGELISYSCNWVPGATFPSTDKAITEKQAQAGFESEFPLELVYTASYDWETKERTTHLIYRQTETGNIDAFTGKKSTFEDYGVYKNGDFDEADVEDDCADEEANPATGAGTTNVTFTEAEKAEMEKEKTFVKAEDALKKMKEQGVFYIPDGYEVTNDRCSFNSYKNYYVRNVSFKATTDEYIDLSGDNFIVPYDEEMEYDLTGMKPRTVYGSFTMNAETGEITQFSCYDGLDRKSLDVEKTTELAGEYLSVLLGKNSSKFVLDENPNITKKWDKYDEDGNPIGQPRTRYISYNAPRVAYGIKSTAENASLTIGNSGKVTYYNLNYYGLKYQKPKNIVTEKQAYSSFFETKGINLKYHLAYKTTEKKVVTALSYAQNGSLFVDAFTGRCVSSDGTSVIVTVAGVTGYSDLENSKYKKYAEKLLSYGISISDKNGNLSENEAITVNDFANLMSYCGFGRYYSINLDSSTADRKVTNKLAAKLLVSALYGDNIFSIKGIFKSPFKDVKDTNSYVGYIAVANAQGLMKGTSKGYFKPNEYLTRGKALKFFYDYLS